MDKLDFDLVKIGKEIDEKLLSFLKKNKITQKRLIDAFIYSTIGSGKRIRAYLLVEAFRLFDNMKFYDDALNIAASLELIHTYSLIHDDLPSMDNSLLRRGKKTCHIKYDEATAILLGDGLQSLAFEIITNNELTLDDRTKVNICNKLAQAIGFKGMVAGQMMDLISEGRYDKFIPDKKFIIQTQRLKTGALIDFSLQAGGIIGGAKKSELEILSGFGKRIGLAFQIVDDILDATSNEENLGKTTDLDSKQGKVNFVTLLGLEKSRKKVEDLIIQAKSELEKFSVNTENLMKIAEFVETRKN
ncbi:MAG: geranylgeranyl pyrophosphate synthase [Alphaproteobacteria bacterium]|nr:MAG: geranylgeranyl pyrophosphate synthase [Alphaproteobacteria bacterium]